MNKILCLGMAVVVAAGISITPSLVGAQDKAPSGDAPLTQQQVKQQAQQAAQLAQQKWNPLTPAQQKQIVSQAQVSAVAAMQKWNAMTPQQRQQAWQHAQAGNQALANWWKSPSRKGRLSTKATRWRWLRRSK